MISGFTHSLTRSSQGYSTSKQPGVIFLKEFRNSRRGVGLWILNGGSYLPAAVTHRGGAYDIPHH